MGRRINTPTRVMMAVDLVSPAPRRLPDRINWGVWMGCMRPNRIIMGTEALMTAAVSL